MNLMPFVVGWGLLVLVVIVLAVYRSALARQEDDIVHVGDAGSDVMTARQIAVAKKLGTVGRWTKITTVLAVLWGLGLLGMLGYQAWVHPPGYSG